MKKIDLLKAVGSEEETTFGELCDALGDNCPEDKEEWADLFRIIRSCENDELIEVERKGNKIDAIILTESGKEMVKNA